MERVVNAPLMRKVVEHIEAHPEEWDQEEWVNECGTTFCFAGHALVMTGHDVRAVRRYDGFTQVHIDGKSMGYTGIAELAAEELGIPIWTAHQLFEHTNSWDTVRSIVEAELKAAGERL